MTGYRWHLQVFLFICSHAISQNSIDLTHDTWRLWPDTAAKWQFDTLYLPPDVDLSKISHQPPTVGWNLLTNDFGKQVKLPTTVEEHYWGEFGLKPYNEGYFYEKKDTIVKDGSYRGVSWWWTTVTVPKSFKSKRIFFQLPSARLRAEIYINHQLAGYHLIGETFYECDVTEFIKPGKVNHIAIRVTNPGGRFDWIDFNTMWWGDYEFQASHGFGGLDSGISLVAKDDIFIEDCWILNYPDLKRVSVNLNIQNPLNRQRNFTLNYLLLNHKGEKIKSGTLGKYRIEKDSLIISKDINSEAVEPWSIDKPMLYTLKLKLISEKETDSVSKTFGFRWFQPENIGEDAILTFNHERILVLSAITWNFWGYNGLFPTDELALKEIYTAKELGLNCLHSHRNIANGKVLSLNDEYGLLRSLESGGGVTALGKNHEMAVIFGQGQKEFPDIDISGEGGEPNTFTERYMEEKILRMVKMFRSHPSVIMYTIQNEIHPDLNNPRIFNLIHKMRELDPSRPIVLKSGNEPYHQAWVMPYSEEILFDDGDGISSWCDKHTVGGPGVWKDFLYVSSDSFTHKSISKEEIMIWGEMFGVGSPDNHAKIVDSYQNRDTKGYDYQDHKSILEGYDSFIDQWGFRNAFPDNSDLFEEIASKSYDFWGRTIETARLSDENDMLVINGWESTSIENHSGLVDNLRNFKSDPAIIARHTRDCYPVIKTSSTVYEKGKPIEMDLFLLCNKPRLKIDNVSLSVYSPDGTVFFDSIFSLPDLETDKFVSLIGSSINTSILNQKGLYTIKANIEGVTSKKDIWVIDMHIRSELLRKKVAVIGNNPELKSYLKNIVRVEKVEFDSDEKYDLIVASHAIEAMQHAKSGKQIIGTNDQELFQTEHYGKPGELEYVFKELPPGDVKVTLLFAETYFEEEAKRVFDVHVNDEELLTDFDIFQTAGYCNAYDTTFTIEHQGKIRVHFPSARSNSPKICGIKLEQQDTIIAINCGGTLFTDSKGLMWMPFTQPSIIDRSVYESVQKGSNLLMLPQNYGAIVRYGESLNQLNVVSNEGALDPVRGSWMGSWVFVRENELFKELPQNCVMSSFYQVGASEANGLLVADENVKVYAGFGKDHDSRVAASTFDAVYGQGRIVFHGYFGLSNQQDEKEPQMHPLISEKLIINAIEVLTRKSQEDEKH